MKLATSILSVALAATATVGFAGPASAMTGPLSSGSPVWCPDQTPTEPQFYGMVWSIQNSSGTDLTLTEMDETGAALCRIWMGGVGQSPASHIAPNATHDISLSPYFGTIIREQVTYATGDGRSVTFAVGLGSGGTFQLVASNGLTATAETRDGFPGGGGSVTITAVPPAIAE